MASVAMMKNCKNGTVFTGTNRDKQSAKVDQISQPPKLSKQQQNTGNANSSQGKV